MTCAEFREAVLDALTGDAPPGSAAEVRHHRAGCPACARWARETEDLWGALGSIPAPELGDGARARIAGRLRRRSASPRAIVVAAYAATLALAFLAGRGTGPTLEPVSTDTPGLAAGTVDETASSAPQWILLLHEPTGAPLTVAGTVEAAAAVEEYRAWAMALAGDGRLVSAEKLEDGPGAWIPEAAARPTLVSGFFLVRAPDRAEAERIAAESPHVRRGGTVEVRRVDPT